MHRLFATLYPAALLAGALAIAWAAWAAAQHHGLAFGVAALIGAAYALGAWELRRLRQASTALAQALDGLATPPTDIAPWLNTLPATLRDAVRHSLDSGRAALPGPALAPALAGLAVLLGMLGTFIGLVITFGGTAQALQVTTDLTAMRTALSAPVQGLGLAFGSSVAGVAASAMLGLMTALVRRERAAVGQRLQAALGVGGPLRAFTAAQARVDAAQAQATQLQTLPTLLAQVQAHSAEALTQFTAELGQRLSAQQAQFQAQWLAEQQRFHADTEGRFQALATAVEGSLSRSLQDGARLAGEALAPAVQAIAPAVQASMAAVAAQAEALHQRVGAAASTQLQALHTALEAGNARTEQALQRAAQAQTEALHKSVQQLAQGFETRLTDTLAATQAHSSAAQAQVAEASRQAQAALAEASAAAAQHMAASASHTEAAARSLLDGFAGQSASLLAGVAEQTSTLLAQTQAAQASTLASQAQADARRLAAWQASLADSAAQLQQAWVQAQAQAQAHHAQLSQTLADTAREVVAQAETQARATIHEVSSLLHTAADAPRAAGEVVAALRAQLSDSLARDNAALTERAELMQTLQTLLGTLNQAAGTQRTAIDELVGSSARLLGELGERVAAQTALSHDTLNQTATEMATHIAGSAAEMASLGEGFGAAVAVFHSANESLVAHLQRLDGTLAAQAARSDEQLGYYVTQAREVIDLCLSAQRQVLDGLQAVAAPQAGAAHG